MKKRRCFYLELNRLYKKSVQATSLSPARILFYLIALCIIIAFYNLAPNLALGNEAAK